MLLPLLIIAALGQTSLATPAASQLVLGHHAAVYKDGLLAPWIPWKVALSREMAWYGRCPKDHGYPLFCTVTFMDGRYGVIAGRTDSIPAMQNGMGILSYLQYDDFTHHTNPEFVATARSMGDYILEQALTPNEGAYPGFPRSTGRVGKWPQPADCGSQDDQPFEIQPDKGAIAGYALLRLYRASRETKYLREAVHIARMLALHERPGDASHSPWPFRADFRTGATRNEVGGDTAFFLRLFDGLKDEGYPEFEGARHLLWDWIKKVQIPSALGDGMEFVQFFEDHHNETNRTAWGPLNLARYLIERKSAIDPEGTRTL